MFYLPIHAAFRMSKLKKKKKNLIRVLRIVLWCGVCEYEIRSRDLCKASVSAERCWLSSLFMSETIPTSK